MANSFLKKAATPCRLTLELTGDGTIAGPTLANAADLQANMVAGPLKDAFNAAYNNQAAMRDALCYGNPVRMSVRLQATGNDTTATPNQITVDVDTDAVTPTKPEVNVTMSDTTGQVAILEIEYVHTLVR